MIKQSLVFSEEEVAGGKGHVSMSLSCTDGVSFFFQLTIMPFAPSQKW